jgi:N6-adenosine-specific RNA methylase IME4
MTLYTDFSHVPGNTYDVLYADPPWHYYGESDKYGAAGKHYGLMSDADLAAMPVRAKCRDRAVLFMWATCPRLDAAVRLLGEWGFFYRGVAFVWVKTTRTGKVIHGQGVRPTVTKPTTELVLVGSTVRLGRPLPLLDESVGQVVMAPRSRHSEKPLEVRRRIERLFGPDALRLELFARGNTVEGWDRFGNELSEGSLTLEGMLGIYGDDEEETRQEVGQGTGNHQEHLGQEAREEGSEDAAEATTDRRR